MKKIMKLILFLITLLICNCSDISNFSNKTNQNKIITYYYENNLKKEIENKNNFLDNNKNDIAALTDSKKEIIYFGRIPYADVREMYNQHQPLLNYLKEKLKKEVTLKFYSNYSQMIKGIIAGEVQIAWMGPVSYVIAYEQMNNTNKIFRPLVKPQRRNVSYFQCDIITRKNSNIKTLQDLTNKKFAFLDTKSSAGFVLPIAMLEENGVKIEFNEQNFLQHFGNICKAVYLGKFDAGATFEGAYKVYLSPEEQQDIEIIAKSETVPFEPICLIQIKKNNEKNDEEYKIFQDLFLQINDNIILKNLDTQKFLPATTEEYNRLSYLIKKVLMKYEKIFE